MNNGVCVIQVPYDSGARDQRMGRGPARLLEHGALDRLSGAGPVQARIVEAAEPSAPEIALAFELQRRVADEVRSAVWSGAFPLLLAGNCSVTLGALAGLGAEGKRDIGLMWFDAHGDLNTPETTRSGFLDGMALGMIMGDCWRGMTRAVCGFQTLAEERVVLVGARDLDPAERRRLDGSAIHEVGCEDIAARGAAAALERVFDAWSGRLDGIYLHVDLDVHDPVAGRFNTYQAPGGLSEDQMRDCLQASAARAPIVGCTFSAYDPACDLDDQGLATALDLLRCLADGIGKG